MSIVSNEFEISTVFQDRLKKSLSGEERNSVEIAKDMSISKDILIRALKAGLIPSTRSLIKIADYTEDSIDYLIGLNEKNYSAKSLANLSFQDRLTELKVRNKTKFGTIASEIGISRSLFNSWENNNYIPSLEIAYQLATHFAISIDYLLARTETEKYKD